MEILIAEKAGFCFGVKRAFDLTREAASQAAGPIHVLGPLVHNPQAIALLDKLGVSTASDLEEVSEGTLVIRCHGVPPSVIKEAKDKGLTVIDATCPFVARAIELARRLKDEGYPVVIVGDPEHPEVVAINGATDNQAEAIKEPEDLVDGHTYKRVGVLAQTTQTLQNLQDCVSKLLERSQEVRVYNTICTATSERQAAALHLAQQVDVMLVVGGRNSANTRRLVEICGDVNARVYHIEEAHEIEPSWFQGAKKVGITAGASTPSWIIEGVLDRMTELNKELDTLQEEQVEEVKAEEVQAEASDAAEGATQAAVEETAKATVEQQLADYESSFVNLQPGQIVTGRVEQIGADEIMVDIGYKFEGTIPIKEAGSEELHVGEEIEVYVAKVEDDTVLLSKRRADREKAWKKLQEAYENGTTIEAVVKERVKGGLLVDVGVRGFIPASHVDMGYVDDLDKYVKEHATFSLKVIELDRAKNNVVLSRKQVLEEEYEKAKKRVFEELKEGDIVKGEVRRLTDFGAFVDIGHGVEGLLHVSEMSWGRVRHPKDVVAVGDTIDVMILKLEPDRERISLGLKQTKPDPWHNISARYRVDQIVEGEITRIVDFGAFVQLEEGVEGLVHISQLADYHVTRPEDVVTTGEKVRVKILNIDEDAHRIGLSLRDAQEGSSQSQPKQEEPVPEPTDNGNVTIGDVVGDLSSLFEKKSE